MSRTDLIKTVAKETGFTQKDVKKVIETGLDVMRRELIDSKKLVMDGIGTLRLSHCVGSKAGFMPKDKKEMSYYRSGFTLSAGMKRELNEEQGN